MDLTAYWMAPVVLGGSLLTAFLVNRFAPRARPRIRRLVIIFALYLLAIGSALLLESGHETTWSFRFHVAARLFEEFALVNIVATLLFDIALARIKFAVSGIVTDLFVGFGYFIVVLSSLHTAGMQVSDVVATSAVASGILALSLQATLGNILGGVALQIDGSIHEGDWIQLENGKQGRVKAVRWRHTVVETRDWSTMIVPNAALLASNIMILGKRDGAYTPQRMWVYFQVDFRFAPSHVIEVVTEAMLAAPLDKVALDPKPSVVCMDLARDGKDSFALYAVRYWLTDLAVDDPTNSTVRARVYAALKRAGIPLAKPTQSLFMSPDDAHDPEREARHRAHRIDAINAMDLFKPLTSEERLSLVDHLRPAPFTANEIITHQGAVAHWLYILSSGTAEICVKKDGKDAKSTHVATISAPDFFGEMGLMTGEPRQADVLAKTDVECFRLDKEAFTGILLKRPELAKELSEKLAKRRVELFAVREDMDAAAKSRRMASEQERILKRIQSFFGLSDT